MAKKGKDKSSVTKKNNDSDVTSDDIITLDIQPFLTPIAIILGSIIISISLLIGLNGIDGVGTSDDVAEVPPPEQQVEEFPETSVSIDDDPYLGDIDNAKVAIVEFSDYNCSFCQRHHQQVHPQLVEQYVNSGDVVLVYRDFPGVGGQTTSDAANATACAREQIGNDGFFDLIKEMYQSTATKDVNLVDSIVAGYDIDQSQYDTCVEENRYADEVQQDLQDGQAAGVSGTPGFIVGVINDEGVVEGKLIAGAYPFSDFEEIIGEYL